MALRLHICTKELRFERGCSLAAAAAAPIARKRVEEAHRAFTRGEAEFDHKQLSILFCVSSQKGCSWRRKDHHCCTSDAALAPSGARYTYTLFSFQQESKRRSSKPNPEGSRGVYLSCLSQETLLARCSWGLSEARHTSATV